MRCALGQVVGGDDRDEIRRAGALDVVGDRQAGIGEQVADQHVAIALLDQSARLLQGGVGVRSVVLDNQFDLAAAHLALDLIEIELHALDHFLAAGGDDAGERRQQADLDRARLGLGASARVRRRRRRLQRRPWWFSEIACGPCRCPFVKAFRFSAPCATGWRAACR